MRTTHCTLHTPGHSVHYIQTRQITDFARHYPDRCRSVAVADLGAGWFETVIDGETRRGWHHDHDLVTDVARDSVLGEVWYVPDFGALVRWTGAAQDAATVLVPAWDGDGRTACLSAGHPVVVGGGGR